MNTVDNKEQPEQQRDSSNTASYLKSIFSWGSAEGKEAGYQALEIGEEVKNHAMATLRMFQMTLVLNLIVVLIYLIGSRYTYQSYPGAQQSFYYVMLGVSVFSALQYLLITGRVAFPLGLFVLLESASLAVAKTVISVLPDWFVNIFDKDNQLRNSIQEGLEHRNIAEISGDLIRTVMAIFAWVLIIDEVVLTVPWIYYSLQAIGISVVATIGLIFAIYGFRQRPFWLKKIQDVSVYFMAGLIIFHLFVAPGLAYIGFQANWGDSGRAKIIFWFVFSLIMIGWLFSSFKVDKESGKLHVSGLSFGAALIVLLIGLMYGGEVIRYARDVKAQAKLPGLSIPTLAITPAVSDNPVSAKVIGKDTIFVDARAAHGNRTGVSLKTGSMLEVKASGKSVWKNIPVGNPTKYEECGPNGTAPNGSPLISESEYMSNIGQYLCPAARKGELIAKVGNGTWFPIGENYKGEVTSDGELIFAINDVDLQKGTLTDWQDNSKGFQVAYKVN